MDLFSTIGHEKLIALWKIFLMHPVDEFSQTSALKEAHLAKATSIKWLRILEKNKLVAMIPRGRMNCYQLTRNPLNKLMKTSATVALLLPLAQYPEIEVFLFGSAARGEDVPTSDIDLLVIGKISRHQLSEISQLGKVLNRPVKPVVFTPIEWAAMRTKDPAFYERVEKDKVKITWI